VPVLVLAGRKKLDRPDSACSCTISSISQRILLQIQNRLGFSKISPMRTRMQNGDSPTSFPCEFYVLENAHKIGDFRPFCSSRQNQNRHLFARTVLHVHTCRRADVQTWRHGCVQTCRGADVQLSRCATRCRCSEVEMCRGADLRCAEFLRCRCRVQMWRCAEMQMCRGERQRC